MPRNKRIKGGEFKLNDTILAKIKNLSTPNNLNPRDVLLNNEYLDEEGYILDNEGKRIEDSIYFTAINYEDAILINNILYDINSIYQTIISQSGLHKIDVIRQTIAEKDIEKIYIKIMSNFNNPNNLKSLQELISLNRIKIINGKYYLTYYNEELLKDPYSNEPIEYKDAFLLNGIIYDVISLHNHIIDTENQLNKEDMKKIKLMIPFAKRIGDFDNKINNLKLLITLKRLGYIDEENYLIGDDGSKIKDPLTNEEIKYENGILINGNLYDINSIYESMKTQIDDIKIDFFGIEISKENINKINLKKNMYLIADTSNYNNLKDFDDLRLIGNVIGSYMKFNDNIRDLFTNNQIYYDEAILINHNIYHIDSIYNRISYYHLDWFGIKIADEDIKKIKKMHFMWQLYETNEPTKLRSYHFFKKNKLIDADNHILDENGEPFIDPYTDLKIKYENGVIINNNLYDAISLYIAVSIRDENKVDYYNRRIISSDYKLVEKKCKLRDLEFSEAYIYVLNIYTKQIEKRIKGIDIENFEDIEYINDLIKNFYDIIINKYYRLITISNNNICKIIQNLIYYLRIINKFDDRIRLLFNSLKIINDLFKIFFDKLHNTYQENIQIYYNLFMYLNYFYKYLNISNFNIFLNYCSSLLLFFKNNNYELFLQKQKAEKLYILKLKVANKLANEFIEICEINDIDFLMNFLNEISKALSLSIINENKKILKVLALHLINKSFEILKSSNEPSVVIDFIKKSFPIIYKLSFNEDLKDFFEVVNKKYNFYLHEILLEFNIKKALQVAREKVNKEYDDFIKNLLKAYENILKMYMLSFMDDIFIYIDKLEELERNVNKYCIKAKQNFEVAKKAIETFHNIRPPTVRERFSKGIKGISSIFSRKRVVPIEQSPNKVSSIKSISIPKPEIPSLSSLKTRK